MNQILVGDCLIKLKELEDNSVDSIVTDPPAGISFMGKSWDSAKGGRDSWIAWMQEVATECKRVLKPGGHAFVWAIPRTSHWTATAWENAGFEIRDVVAHVFGSGFPKSHNIGKSVDKLQGNEREEIWHDRYKDGKTRQNLGTEHMVCNALAPIANGNITTKGTSEFEGWGTALKPAREDWLLMRKPLAEKTVAENCLKWGTGGINIDESRVEGQWNGSTRTNSPDTKQVYGDYAKITTEQHPQGRFPANLCWSCDCDNNYLTGNALFDILSNISNQIKLCQSKNSTSNALNVEQKNHQQDTTSEEKTLCFAVENVDTLFLGKILGKTLEVIFSVDTECSVEMLEESMNTSLNTSLSGNEKMEEYQKVLKYITLTATKLITELKTCNLSQSQIIGNFITKVISGIQEQSRVKSHSPECWVRECFPETKSVKANNIQRKDCPNTSMSGRNYARFNEEEGYNDSGNASRFFKSIIYQAKSSKRGRTSNGTVVNPHPTVKSVPLMEYLIKMVTPKGGIVLDPFCGSGSTLVAAKQNGFQYIGIEMTEEYIPIIEARLNAVQIDLFTPSHQVGR